MEFRSQRPRGGGNESNSTKRRDDRTVRPKRRVTEVERSSFRSAHPVAHRSSLNESSSKDYLVDSRKMPSSSKPFSDDSRLSVLMKRAMRNDDDRDKRLSFIKQLKEYLTIAENHALIQKAYDNLFIAMLDMLRERTTREIKQEVACCLGVVGYIISKDSSRFFDQLFPKILHEHGEETKIMLLVSLFECLKQDSSKEDLSSSMPMLMAKCQTVLENADTPELLIAIVDVISHIVRVRSQCFQRHFRDTVDILVGWHIDSSQKDALIEYTSNALVGFRDFWSADLSFSVTLLGQFLEDMEAYSEDLLLVVSNEAVADSEIPDAEECVVKIASLLRVFTTVIKSLLNGSNINNPYLLELFGRLVKCTDIILNNEYREPTVIAANNCLKAMLDKLGVECLPVKSPVCQFVADEAVMRMKSTRQLHTSFLNLAAKVVNVFGTNLTTDFLMSLMGPKSMLPGLCFAEDILVLDAVLHVYKSIMALKSVPLLELAYRCVLSMLETAYNILLREAESDVHCTLVTSKNCEDETLVYTFDTSQAETMCIFCICVIAEIGNAKNNIIGMWALSPSIFSLFGDHLLLLNETLMENYPAVHFAAVQAFHSHCSRHDNFVIVSHLVTHNSLRDVSLLANVSATNAGNLSIILGVTADLLYSMHTPDDTRCLVLKWALELTELFHSSQVIFSSCAFIRLMVATIASGYNPHRKITRFAGQCLQAYVRCAAERSSLVLNSCRDLVCVRVSDSDNEVRSVYLELLQLLPLPIANRLAHSVVDRQPSSLTPTPKDSWGDAYQHVARSHMMRLPSGTFHSHNFTAVLSHLLSDHVTQHSKTEVLSWLERQFFSCQRWNDKDNVSGRDDSMQLSSVIDRNERFLWFWATWEASQFCVLSRLRTPLGKPQDTFSTIESAIKQCLAALRSQDGETVSLKTASSSSKQAADPYSVCLRTSLLLQFMEHLERHIYNGIEGCAVAMAPAPKAVRTFFYTNRGTCREWLGRVRSSLMSIAQRNRDPAMVVRLGYQLLKDLADSNSTSSSDFEQGLVLIVDALCQLRSPEAIQGLIVWSRQVTNRRMNWMKSAVDLASAKYELAVSGFKSCVQNYFTPEGSVSDDCRETSPSPFTSPRHVPLKRDSGSVSKIALLHKSSEPVTPHDINVLSFMVKQVCESYVKIGAWDEALKWQETTQSCISEHSGTPYQKAFRTGYDTNYLSALSSFDKFDFDAVKLHLGDVSSSTVSAASIESSWWDVNGAVNIAEKTMMRAVTSLLTSSDITDVQKKACDLMLKSQLICESMVRVSTLSSPFGIDSKILTQLSQTTQCHSQFTVDSPTMNCSWTPNGSLGFDTLEHDVSAALRLIHQIKLQELIQKQVEGSTALSDVSVHITDLRLATANLARRQSNFGLCERLLLREMPESAGDGDVLSVLSEWSVFTDNDDFGRFRRLRVEREAAKLLFGRGQSRDAVETIVSSIARAVRLKPVTNDIKAKSLSPNNMTELTSRSLLTLVKWLQTDSKYSNQLAVQLQSKDYRDEDAVSPVIGGLKLLTGLEVTRAQDGDGIAEDLATTEKQFSMVDSPAESDLLAGRLLHLSTMQCPSLAKSWFALASWCYKWGRKAVDCAAHGNVDLTADEKARILELLPPGVNHAQTEAIFTVLGHIHEAGSASNEEDISDQDQMRYDDGADTVRRQLVSCSPLLQIYGSSCIEQLVDLWRTVVRRVYHYYQLSAKAYFTYLKLNAESSTTVNMDGNITATLRILRLLVKHAWELRDVLEDGLARSPTAPWKGIIPQLFSRLNHPEPYVRQSVSDLLCRVAQDSPHLIVYPAVVGFSSSKDLVKEEANRDGLLNEYLSQAENTAADSMEADSTVLAGESPSSQDEDALIEDRGANALQNCFATILDCLTVNNSKMISEVQLFVSELRRITLLWDELWLGALSQLYQDVTRRLKQLENEVAKVKANTTLTAEDAKAIIVKKHQTILKPTIYAIERLQEITQRPAETPHELAFQETYGKMIDNTLKALRNPANPECPNASWLLFKQLHHSLQQRAQKRTGQLLNMEDISCRLTSLKHTVIAMPGHNSSSIGQVTTIDSIHNSVQILPTKTKPKKLIFVGSDGVKYPYLFKGLEDLHLDERIMQLLSIINNMFVTNTGNQRQLYRARHYSVTPLGARSGLIQWVDGAVPMFSLYKRWHQRDAMMKQQQQQLLQQQQQLQQQQSASSATRPVQPAPSTSAAIVVPRPSELFYNKLNPLLREKGITSTDNRKDWPLTVLRKVLEELMTETPKDLLAKELWCSSTLAAEWWLVTQSYARSTAVISMIGYIIGLGDRHLDNVLIDLSTGEVVHIDYNVCFEKGKSLRVPEKVPFRMTQNLETALGLTGVEGTFRLSCEHAMRTMRRGRETLLTLLEAFVYDPLVDWTVGADWGGAGYTGAFYGGGESGSSTVSRQKQSRRDMERDITNDMFCIRVAEAKVTWLENRDQLLFTTQNLSNSIHSLLNVLSSKDDLEIRISKIQQQLEYLNDALVDDSTHTIKTLISRYREYIESQQQKEELVKVIHEKLNEYDISNKAHEYALTAIRGPKLQQLSAAVNQPVVLTALAGFQPVVDFLQGAGQGHLVSQCEQLCSELQSAIQDHVTLTRSSIDVLHTYATVISHHPRMVEKKNRCFKWHQWLLDLICEFTAKRVQRIESEMHSLYSVKSTPQTLARFIVDTERRLQAISLDSKSKLQNLVELRNTHRTDTGVQLQTGIAVARRFMQEQGMSGVLAMASTITLELSTVTRRFLDIDTALSVDSLHLSEPRSPGGVWFLDQLVGSTNMVQMMFDLLSEHVVEQVLSCPEQLRVQAVVNASHTIYLSLQDLHMNFCTVIVPEAITAFQAEEPSVIGILQDLDVLVNSLGVSLDEAGQQLNVIFNKVSQARETNTMLSSEDEELLLTLKNAQERFEKLYELRDDSSSSQLTGGQMLLMGFAGMFSRLKSDFRLLLEARSKVVIPVEWSLVGIIQEALQIQVCPFFTEAVVNLLSIIFFVKQLKVMHQFFHRCHETAGLLLGSMSGNFYDEEILAAPVKMYIGDYLKHHINGIMSQTLGYMVCRYLTVLDRNDSVGSILSGSSAQSSILATAIMSSSAVLVGDRQPSLSLQNLCLFVVDATMASGAFDAVQYEQTELFLSNLLDISRVGDVSRQLDRSIQLQHSICQRSQLQLMCYQWLHEDVLTNSGIQLNTLPRSSLMTDLKKAIQAVVIHERDAVAAIQSKQEQLKKTVVQRLKWAAGANPLLAQTLQLYEDALSAEQGAIEHCLNLANELVTIGKSVLHFEAMMTRTQEAVSGDGAFLILMNKCENCCLPQETGESKVTDSELGLMELQIPHTEDGLTGEWLTTAVKLLTTELTVSRQLLDNHAKTVENAKDCIKTNVTNIRTVLATHHKLMSDMRVILKAMAKHEEHDYGSIDVPGGICSYLGQYKSFSEQYTTMLKTAYAEDLDVATYRNLEAMASGFRDQISRIYDDLVLMAPSLTHSGDVSEVKGSEDMTIKKTSSIVARADQAAGDSVNFAARLSTASSVAHKEKITRDPKTGKAMQERNSYAVGVWRRVKLKLDGRDVDINKRMTVAEQVEYVIKEATSMDNLAVLYEGWTPWV